MTLVELVSSSLNFVSKQFKAIFIINILSSLILYKDILDPGWQHSPIENHMVQPNILELKEGMKYASIAVCSEEQLKSWSCVQCKEVPNTKFIEYYDNEKLGTSGYLAIDENDKVIILSFRGTKNLRNKLQNIFLSLIRFKTVQEDKGVYVHSGFLLAMESLSKKFLVGIKKLREVEEYKDYPIRIVGHSLGGSIASLAAIKIHFTLNIPFDKIELFTYGQPRTGNYIFAKWYNRQPIKSARVVNEFDMVPHTLTSAVLGFAHHGLELVVSKDGKTKFCNATVLEDSNCTYSVKKKDLKYLYHTEYFGVNTTIEKVC